MSVEKHQHADGWVSDETYRVMRRNCEEYKKKCIENEKLQINEDIVEAYKMVSFEKEAFKKQNEELGDNLTTIADMLEVDYDEITDIHSITEELGEKLNTLEEWDNAFDGQDAGQIECELNDRKEECDELREKIDELKKEMEELKKKNTQLENIKYRVEQTEKSGIDVAKMKKELDKMTKDIVKIKGMDEKMKFDCHLALVNGYNYDGDYCPETIWKFIQNNIVDKYEYHIKIFQEIYDKDEYIIKDGEVVYVNEEDEEEEEQEDEWEEEKGYGFIKSETDDEYILEVRDLKTGGNTKRFTSSKDKKDDSVCVWDTQFKQMIINQGLDDFSKMMDALNKKMMFKEIEKKNQERIKKGLPIYKGPKKKKR